MPIAYLSLGSNLDKERNLPAAVRLLATHGRLLAVSAVYETAPVGNPDDPAFFNAAVALETNLPPAELKRQVLAHIEQQLGRQRSPDPNAPRTIDVDISLYDDAILDLGKLVDTLLDGLVGGIPLTHCVLLIQDRTTMAFTPYRERTTLDRPGPLTPLRPDDPIVPSRFAAWIFRYEDGGERIKR